jgi:uncharacterized membrane protein
MWRRVAAGLIDLSSLLGLFVYVTGGYWHRSHGRGLGFDVDFTNYGPLFWPLALCLVFGYRPGGYVLPAIERARGWFEGLPGRKRNALVVLSIALLTVAMSGAVYARYMTFQAGMDLAIYANACRNALFSTMKGDVWLLADHFEPLLIVFTPLCRQFDPAVVLLFAQELGFGLGAAGVYALGRARGWPAGQAWLVAMLYLGFTGNVTVASYDFHLLTLALAVIPWLWWALEVDRYALAALFALLFIGLKESAPLSLAGLGLYLLLVGPNKRRFVGAGMFVAGAGAFIVIMKVVYPFFRNGEETMYFAKYYGHLGANLGEFVRTIVTRPIYFVSTLLTQPKRDYMIALFMPFLFLPVVRPQYMLPIAPALLVNIASNDPNLLGLTYHYEAEIYPTLFAMALIAFGTIQEQRLRRFWLAGLLVLFSAPSATATFRRFQPNPVQKRLHAQLKAHVPKGLAVAAPQRIAAHLTYIPKLYMFDYWHMEQDWKRADVVVIGYPGERLGWYGWSVLEYLKLPRMLPMLRPIYQDPDDPHFRIFQVVRTPIDPLTHGAALDAASLDRATGSAGLSARHNAK